MSEHRCTFDSEQGFTPALCILSLRCECGRWAAVGSGKMSTIPREPPTLCTRVEKEFDAWIFVVVAIIFLVALWAL